VPLQAITAAEPLWLTFLLSALIAGVGVAVIRFRHAMLRLGKPGRQVAWMNRRFSGFEDFNRAAWSFTCWFIGTIFILAGVFGMVIVIIDPG
jgi:hypothetical protein